MIRSNTLREDYERARKARDEAEAEHLFVQQQKKVINFPYSPSFCLCIYNINNEHCPRFDNSAFPLFLFLFS